MSEKRFEKAKFGTVIEDNFKHDTLWTCTECIDRLNEIAKENEELKQTIKTICKDYENHHGMDIRNAEWFTAW